MTFPNLVRITARIQKCFTPLNNFLTINTVHRLQCSVCLLHVNTGSYTFSQRNEKSKLGLSNYPASDEAIFDKEFKTISTLLKSRIKDKNLHEVAEWFDQVMIYNVPHGKKNRGIGVMKTYKHLVPEASTDERRLAAILGWCIEMCQAFFLVNDDVMDQSTTRRGMPCWYRQKNVGLNAINDAILLEHGLYQVLKEFFRNHPSYIDMVNTFHEAVLNTATGQCLDMLSTSPNSGLDLEKFTESRYSAIVQFKTAYYTFCLPVHLALLLAGQGDCYAKNVEALLLTVGHFFQVQDDFLDCFGDPTVTGKHGTDITDGKCSWPMVMALQRVGSEDRIILQENYGVSSERCLEKVLDIYKKVGIPKIYEAYETETYMSLCQQIESVTQSCSIPVEVFYGLLNKVYKRSK